MDRASLRANYASKQDEELLVLHASDTLLDIAYEELEQEMKQRGLSFESRLGQLENSDSVVSHIETNAIARDADSPELQALGAGKRGLAQLIGIVAGIVAWLAIGAIGILGAIIFDDDGFRTGAAWGGMLAGAGIGSLVTGKLREKWSEK